MYGDIKITLVKTETLAEYVVRTFALERVSLPYTYLFHAEPALPQTRKPFLPRAWLRGRDGGCPCWSPVGI